MFTFDFHDQQAHVKRIADDLVGQYPNCWDVVLPPGFGEDRFADQLRAQLGGHPARPRVAVVGTDNVNQSIAHFIRRIHKDWSESPALPAPLHQSDTDSLDRLFDIYRSESRPLVLVLKRFRKVLDNLQLWVLGKLREQEQTGNLHTVVLTPLPLPELKRWWEAEGHYFCTSDYGNLRHKTVSVLPLSRDSAAVSCEAQGVPRKVGEVLGELTGWYPEPTAAVLLEWVKTDRPGLSPRVRRQLADFARGELREFAEKLDPQGSAVYRDHVIDLYHRFESDKARLGLDGHPWRDIIVDEDGLRAEALGAAALDRAVRSGSESAGRSVWYQVAGRARLLYARRQYEAAAHILDAPSPVPLRPHDRLLHGHAVVMQELGGSEGQLLGNETSVRQVLAELKTCRAILAAGVQGLDTADAEKIRLRYTEIEGVVAAVAVAAAGKVRDKFKDRVVDILAGLAGPEYRNDRAALLLLQTRLETARAMAGDTAAVAYALPLPEQVLRVWAFWAVGVNDYAAPAHDDPAWDVVRANWPLQKGPPTLPQPGGEFGSLHLLAAFALARWLALADPKPDAPEPDFRSFFSGLDRHSPARNSEAHSVCGPSRKRRDDYFRLIDRWLAAAVAASPEQIRVSELLATVEPLPVVSAAGDVEW